jgi:transketolase
MKAMSAADYAGRFIHYGIREHGMAAAMNGMALHRRHHPVFRHVPGVLRLLPPSIRLAALMGERVIHVMTHDSIGLGEDGPTHEPVEHLAALRAIPNLRVFRPCDAVETLECWQLALENRDGPSVLALTRQNLPQLRKASTPTTAAPAAPTRSAGRRPAPTCRCSRPARKSRSRSRRRSCWRSAASRRAWSRCRASSCSPREPRHAARHRRRAGQVGVEAAVRQGWDAIIGTDGAFVGMTGFGASAPYKDLYRHFGITPRRSPRRR